MSPTGDYNCHLIDICKKAKEANEFISKITKNSIADHCNNRGDQYKASEKIFKELLEAVQLLKYARPELNKRMRKNRKTFMLSISALIISFIGIIIAILK